METFKPSTADNNLGSMLNYWIFTVRDDEYGTRGIEIYKQRMSDAFWGLGKNVSNRAQIRDGDNVVFYLAGKGGQRFLGTCILASSYYKLSRQEKEKLDHGPSFRPNYGVRLKEVHVWDLPESIYPLIKKLEFIEDPSKWGSYLQGSISRIPEVDYSTILFAHEFQEVIKLSKIKQPRLTDETSIVKVNRKARDNAFREGIREIYGFFENKKTKLPKEKEFSPHPIFLKGHRRIHGFVS